MDKDVQATGEGADVGRMFDRIARRYDLLNTLLSFGRDAAWRRALVRRLGDRTGPRVLDVATGTGDVLLALAEHGGMRYGIGCDAAAEMLGIGRWKIARRGLQGRCSLVRTDALRMAFADASFDAATIAFGIRNMADVAGALREFHRVLKPGGRLAVLEFSMPANAAVRSMYLIYLRHVVPWLGGFISGDRGAYRYLNRTIETFPCGKALCEIIEASGFAGVQAHALTFGVATVYLGEKRYA